MKLDLLCICERGIMGDPHTHTHADGHSLDLVYVREPGTVGGQGMHQLVVE